jgi:hypothetical protein
MIRNYQKSIFTFVDIRRINEIWKIGLLEGLKKKTIRQLRN